MTASSLYSMLAGVFIVMRMFSIPFWQCIASTYGKQKANLIYNFSLALSTALLFFISEGTVTLAFVLGGFWGWCWGGHFILESMMADVIDYDEVLTNERREAQFEVFHILIPKFYP